MKQNDKNHKKYYIYLQRAKCFVEVTEIVFREFYRFVKRERYVLQKEGKCVCPQSYIVNCDCDCEVCPYRAKPISQDFVKKTDDEDGIDPVEMEFPDSDSIEDDLNYRRLRALVEKLTEDYPDARRIILLRYHGLTDSEIERVIGTGRRTFQYRLKKALQHLGFTVDDFR